MISRRSFRNETAISDAGRIKYFFHVKIVFHTIMLQILSQLSLNRLEMLPKDFFTLHHVRSRNGGNNNGNLGKKRLVQKCAHPTPGKNLPPGTLAGHSSPSSSLNTAFTAWTARKQAQYGRQAERAAQILIRVHSE